VRAKRIFTFPIKNISVSGREKNPNCLYQVPGWKNSLFHQSFSGMGQGNRLLNVNIQTL